MGCLIELLGPIIAILSFFMEIMFQIILWGGYFAFLLFKLIIKLIKKALNKSNNKILSPSLEQKKSKRHLYQLPPSKIYKEVYIKVYINKKFRELKKDDELNVEKLGTDWCAVPTMYYDECTEAPGFNVFEATESILEQFSLLLTKLHNYCGDKFYATIGHEQNKIEYKITIKNNTVFINAMNQKTLKPYYNKLKNSIIDYTYKLYDIDTYLKEEHY